MTDHPSSPDPIAPDPVRAGPAPEPGATAAARTTDIDDLMARQLDVPARADSGERIHTEAAARQTSPPAIASSVDEVASRTGPATTPAGTPTKTFARSLREWLIVVIIAVSAAIVMKVFVVQQFYVSGHSMDTTLHDLDRVLVNKLSYDLHDPNRGDVVVLEEGAGVSERDLIKRVIALPGETIQITDCVVRIDGRVLDEPYLDPAVTSPTNCGQPSYGPLQIEPHHVFVMGDNRPGSGDSRGSLGQVDYDHIVGRAFVVIWPTDHWQWL